MHMDQLIFIKERCWLCQYTKGCFKHLAELCSELEKSPRCFQLTQKAILTLHCFPVVTNLRAAILELFVPVLAIITNPCSVSWSQYASLSCTPSSMSAVHSFCVRLHEHAFWSINITHQASSSSLHHLKHVNNTQVTMVAA